MSQTLERTDLVNRYDQGGVQRIIRSDEGFVSVVGIPTRVGVFPYRNADGSLRRELRHPDDVLRTDSLYTLGGKPFTVGHPPVPVTPENYDKYGQGSSSNEIEVIGDGLIKVIYNIQRMDAIRALDNGIKDLSCGYRTDLVPESGTFRGQPYDARQTNIRYNHTALVTTGRAGSDCGLRLDHLDFFDFGDCRHDCCFQDVRFDEDVAPLIFDLKPSSRTQLPMAKLPTDLFSTGIRYDGMDTELPAGLVQAITQEITAGQQAQQRVDELEEELGKAQTNFQMQLGRADALEDTVDELQAYIQELHTDMEDPMDDVEMEEGGQLMDEVNPDKKDLGRKKKKHSKDMEYEKDGSYKEDEYDEVAERMDMWNEANQVLTAYGFDTTQLKADSTWDVDDIKGFVVGTIAENIREDADDAYILARYDIIAEPVFNADAEPVQTFNRQDSITHADNLQTALSLSRRSTLRTDSSDRADKSPAQIKMDRANAPGALHK